MAERFRYVEVPGYSSITSDLAQSSSDIETEIGAAKEAANLHVEKFLHVKRAEELVIEISKDISRLVRMMPIKQLGKKLKTTKPIVEFSARPTKPIMTETDRELIARSHRALQNLQKNLAELKSELGKA